MRSRYTCFFTFLIVFVGAIILLLCACGKKDKEDGSELALKKIFKINMAHSMTLDTPLHQACLRLKSYANKKSNGRLIIEIYGASSLYSDKDMPEVLPAGVLGMGACSPLIWSGTVPALPLTCALSSSWEHTWRFIDDPEVIRILDKECQTRANCKFLGAFDCAAGDCHAFTKPVRNLEEWKGKKVRAAGELMNVIISALGASPTTISSSEMYEALQRGTIQGVGSTVLGIKGRNIQEAAPYLIRWTFTYSEFSVLINLDKWNNLPDSLQKILKEGVREQMLWSRKVIKGVIEESWNDLAKAPGIKIYNVKDEQAKKWNAIIFPPFRKNYLKYSGESGKRLLARMDALRP